MAFTFSAAREIPSAEMVQTVVVFDGEGHTKFVMCSISSSDRDILNGLRRDLNPEG